MYIYTLGEVMRNIENVKAAKLCKIWQDLSLFKLLRRAFVAEDFCTFV